MPDGGAPTAPRARYDAGFPSDYNPAPPASNSADAEIFAAGARLRDWARDLAKNSSICKAVLDARVAKGVGTGLTYEPMVKDRKGQLLDGLNAKIARLHEQWSEAADVTGELSRAEVERAVWREWDTVGEAFPRKVWRGRTPRRIGYQVQLIPSELVPYGFISASTTATLGIERDAWGAPQRYWVYPYNPAAGQWQIRVPALQPTAVPANEIRHLRRQVEMDGTRGITLFHAVIFRVSDIAEYQQSHRRAARASANLFAAIRRDADYDPGDGKTPEGQNTSTYQHELNLNELQLLDFMVKGEGIEFMTPQHPNVNAVEFVNQDVRFIAASCRCAFSWIAYVFDRAFAAQRTEHVHAWEMLREDRAQFVRDFAKPMLYDEVLRMAILEGRLSRRDLKRADPDTLYDARIDGPTMPSINPLEDRKTAELDQRMGWESRHGNIRAFGRKPNQVDAERMRDPENQAGAEPDTDTNDNGDAEDDADDR